MICLRSAADAANIFTQTRKYAAKNMGICTVPESVPGVIFAKPRQTSINSSKFPKGTEARSAAGELQREADAR